MDVASQNRNTDVQSDAQRRIFFSLAKSLEMYYDTDRNIGRSKYGRNNIRSQIRKAGIFTGGTVADSDFRHRPDPEPCGQRPDWSLCGKRDFRGILVYLDDLLPAALRHCHPPWTAHYEEAPGGGSCGAQAGRGKRLCLFPHRHIPHVHGQHHRHHPVYVALRRHGCQ